MSTPSTPVITDLRVIPVAGHDSMLLNLSGAHGPFFTRNLLVLTDTAGRTGVGEVPGGEKIRQTLEDARELIVGQPLGSQQRLLQEVQSRFADRDSGGDEQRIRAVTVCPITAGRSGSKQRKRASANPPG